MTVDLSSRQIFSPIGGDIFKDHQMRVQERGSAGPFLASQTPIVAISREYLENSKSER